MRWIVLLALGLGLSGCGEQVPMEPGERIYTRYCFSCHAAGVAGAPAAGDLEAWEPRVEKGRTALLQATIAGVPPGMPPMGLCAGCSEEELAAAIDFMIEMRR